MDDFLGLWHGADFHEKEYGEVPPAGSPPVLYHLLHGGEPPPNTTYFGFIQATSVGAEPGFYIQGLDITNQTPVEIRKDR